MTRIISVLLLLVAALGAGSDLAWAGEMHEVCVETNGMDLPPTHEVVDVEVSDEIVFAASSSAGLTTPLSIAIGDRRLESVSDMPPTRPPRG